MISDFGIFFPTLTDTQGELCRCYTRGVEAGEVEGPATRALGTVMPSIVLRLQSRHIRLTLLGLFVSRFISRI